MKNYPSDCTTEQWITLNGDVATLQNRLTMARLRQHPIRCPSAGVTGCLHGFFPAHARDLHRHGAVHGRGTHTVPERASPSSWRTHGELGGIRERF